MSSARLRAWLLASAALWVSAANLAGCGDDETVQPPPPQPNPSGTPAPAAADAGALDGASDAAADAMPANLPPLPVKEFGEPDFSESDRSRDPFRAFTQLFEQQAKARTTNQRNVIMDRYALEEMKLLGIVTRAPARALLADPTGLGWVAKVGDFIGKPELVSTGGPTGVDVSINWRVDRIRESDVVFIREDASHPEIPPTTRVMSLHPLEEDSPSGARR
jgi:type IV pilus assembly protein PilP